MKLYLVLLLLVNAIAIEHVKHTWHQDGKVTESPLCGAVVCQITHVWQDWCPIGIVVPMRLSLKLIYLKQSPVNCNVQVCYMPYV